MESLGHHVIGSLVSCGEEQLQPAGLDHMGPGLESMRATWGPELVGSRRGAPLTRHAACTCMGREHMHMHGPWAHAHAHA